MTVRRNTYWDAPDDGFEYVRQNGAWTINTGGSGGVTDHGALTGLGGDDHLHYHTDARGDARYYIKSYLDTAFANKSNVWHSHVESDITDLQNYSLVGHPHVQADITDTLYYKSPDFTYDVSGELTRVDYDDGTYKLFTYSGGNLTRVDEVQSGQTVRKDFTYSGDELDYITESII